MGTQTQLCVDVIELPGAPGWVAMATGGADNAVRLHVRPPGGEFQLQCKMAGHENWVRSVAFVRVREEGAGGGAVGAAAEGAGGEEVLLLASASQDR